MNWTTPDWQMIWLQIQAAPLLFLATAGLIFSTSYILLMLATKLGDIRPGVQSFILSAMIHLVMALFWGTIVLPSSRGATKATTKPVVIRRVLLEQRAEHSANQPGTSEKKVWEELPNRESTDFNRENELAEERAPMEDPQKKAAVGEAPTAAMPQLPVAEEVVSKPPSEIPLAIPTPKAVAADQMIDIPDETAEARPEVVLNNNTPKRLAAEQPGANSETVRRESNQGTNPAIPLSPDVPTPTAAGPEAMEAESPVAKTAPAENRVSKSAPSPVKVDAFDPGSANSPASETANNPATAANASRFSRSGNPANRNDFSGTGKVARTTTRPEGEFKPGPAVAMSTRPGEEIAAVTTPIRPSLPDSRVIAKRGSAALKDTYKLRNIPQRQRMAVQLGATSASEKAVELSLRWLAMHQNPEGYWDADGYTDHCPGNDRCWGVGGLTNADDAEEVARAFDPEARRTAGKQADSGLTSLVILAFLGAGYTHQEGEYADNVDRAIRWLIRNQGPDGSLAGKANRYERMYCHGMATYALGEACGMMSDSYEDPQLRRALELAVRHIVKSQNPKDGGWRYLPGQEGDMSMFGWQLMALKSAQIAGIPIPDETRAGMVNFLKAIGQGQTGGLASYRVREAVKPSMTAEALFSRQMLGMKRDNPASLEAVAYLRQHPPRLESQDLYYWYYGTLAMYQFGGEPWREWNSSIRDTLVQSQRTTGHAAGSWDPRDGWSRHGGRLYSTALSTLCLEVYYRFLPLYQLTSDPDAQLPRR